MYEPVIGCEAPADENTRIWRYCDFPKFISMLEKQALYFCRADRLEDPFEGRATTADVEEYLAQIANCPEEHRPIFRSNFVETVRMGSKFTGVNCWHLNEYESAGMWAQYVKSGQGVAIQSTYKRLKGSFSGTDVSVQHIGMVQYVDFTKSWDDGGPYAEPYNPLLRKRPIFAHERELRVLTSLVDFSRPIEEWMAALTSLTAVGAYAKVDLEILVEQLHVSPSAPEWFRELVQTVSTKYGLDRQVRPSSLDDAPSW
jgi:hypothetical protein